MPNLVDPNADTEQKMDIYIYIHISKATTEEGVGWVEGERNVPFIQFLGG